MARQKKQNNNDSKTFIISEKTFTKIKENFKIGDIVNYKQILSIINNEQFINILIEKNLI